MLVTQLCPTFCDPMDCSSPCSSVHGILQARIHEQVAISFSRGSSRPRDWTCLSGIGQALFWVCLWMCFWMRLIFKSVDEWNILPPLGWLSSNQLEACTGSQRDGHDWACTHANRKASRSKKEFFLPDCLELGYQCFRAFELSYCLLLDLELASFQPGTYSICSSGLSTLDWA